MIKNKSLDPNLQGNHDRYDSQALEMPLLGNSNTIYTLIFFSQRYFKRLERASGKAKLSIF